MAKYLTEDKSGIVSVLRSLKAEDFEIKESSERGKEYLSSHPSAHFVAIFKSGDKLSDLEKEVMFPISRFGSEETRYNKVVTHTGKKVVLRGVRKGNQEIKMQNAQDDVNRYLKTYKTKLLGDKISEMNASIMKIVTDKNDEKLRNITRHYMDVSRWTFDEKEIVSVEKELEQLRKKADALESKRNKLRYKSALDCVKTTDKISDVVRDHLVEKMEEKGSLDLGMSFRHSA